MAEETTTTEAPAVTQSLMDAPPETQTETTETTEESTTSKNEQTSETSEEKTEEQTEATEESTTSEGEKEETVEGAPEEYADFTAPEGSELDAETIDAFKPIAKELNLTQEQAQRLVDLQTTQSQRWTEAVQQHVIDTRTQWRADAQADETIGGDKFGENLALAKAGRDAFGDDDFKALLDETGIGDHPAMIRMLYRVGRASSEHDFVNTGKPEQRKSFYDHPTSGPKG